MYEFANVDDAKGLRNQLMTMIEARGDSCSIDTKLMALTRVLVEVMNEEAGNNDDDMLKYVGMVTLALQSWIMAIGMEQAANGKAEISKGPLQLGAIPTAGESATSAG